ncbi:nucleotidyltransferase family protein [Paenibacillus phoenicis]|uniref:Nucleotidyltransferase family protein n=1 Tax=Paenibacillus phoenicis TaxID=554117 RepID=A0ABU5PLS8_9BACL|nr:MULTISPECIES: nucleotidyltransferase family protein [Paenibacillus]MCT2194717.1 nucleotidyltransferase family protein [Paenibacillus sp. p3-SID1389]MEA3570898.1 nucleotidyltransferase family protein [Paenibacillus phoenicis]
MKREDIENKLRIEKRFLMDRFYVSKIGLFGSFARDEQTETSDIDLLVEFSRPVGFEFLDLKDYLESVFGREVDLVTPNAIKSYMKDEILSEVQYQ